MEEPDFGGILPDLTSKKKWNLNGISDLYYLYHFKKSISL
jgi:hypothetical protein